MGKCLVFMLSLCRQDRGTMVKQYAPIFRYGGIKMWTFQSVTFNIKKNFRPGIYTGQLKCCLNDGILYLNS